MIVTQRKVLTEGYIQYKENSRTTCLEILDNDNKITGYKPFI